MGRRYRGRDHSFQALKADQHDKRRTRIQGEDAGLIPQGLGILIYFGAIFEKDSHFLMFWRKLKKHSPFHVKTRLRGSKD